MWPGLQRKQTNTTTTKCSSADYDNYLTSLFLPTEVRKAAWAIRAFNVETAKIKDVVSDTNLGKMRFAFWREAVKDIYKVCS
jgi:NADH dehydrogenase [ubiquinone] 1 alpha subcomplex assembly factor 6